MIVKHPQKPGTIASGWQRLKTSLKGASSKGLSFSGFGGSAWGQVAGLFGWLNNPLPSAQYDYERDAAPLHKGGIVLACLKWSCRNFPEAPLRVYRDQEENGEPEVIAKHPLTRLIKRPNKYFSRGQMWAATLMSLLLSGNAYWYKVRSAAGKVVELWWIPDHMIHPCWPEDGSEFLSFYEYHVNGQVYRLDPADVIHFMDGRDPDNIRKGLSPLAGVLREICTDNEAATFCAALLRNMGIPGMFIVPKGDGSIINKPNADKIKADFMEKTTGDRRGEPYVWSVPMEITAPGFSPQQLVVDVIRRLPEERITAALGIPAIVVGLGAGLARATYANYKEAREAAHEAHIVPLQVLISETLDSQLLADLGDEESEYCGFDNSKVRALQEDQNELAERATLLFQGGVARRSDARRLMGWPVEPDDDIYIQDLAQSDTQETTKITPLQDGSAKHTTARKRRRNLLQSLLDRATKNALEIQNLRDHLGMERLDQELESLQDDPEELPEAA